MLSGPCFQKFGRPFSFYNMCSLYVVWLVAEPCDFSVLCGYRALPIEMRPTLKLLAKVLIYKVTYVDLAKS